MSELSVNIFSSAADNTLRLTRVRSILSDRTGQCNTHRVETRAPDTPNFPTAHPMHDD